MQKKTKLLLLFVAILLIAATPAMAQTAGAAPSGIAQGEVKFVGAVVGMAIAAGLCGLGQGKAVVGAAEGIGRNPGAAAAIRGALIIGLVLIESLAIYTLLIVFAKY